MDEVLALTAAREPTLSEVWQAIWSGTDFSPPTYHFFLHGLINTVGAADSRLLWRLPSILAIYGAAICTYLFLVRSHLSRLSAVLGFGIVLAFKLFDHAIEVREYAMLVFGLAAAFLLWSEIEEDGPRYAKAFGLWLVLSACLCIHFYGIIEVAAIGTAEFVYAIWQKRIRTVVWVALLLTVPVQAALLPLAHHLATFNNGDNLAPAYYAKPSVHAFFTATNEVVGGAAFLLAALVVICAALLAKNRGLHPTKLQPVRIELKIVLIALCVLPFTTFAFSALVTKSFSARYMAAAALIPAIGFPWLLDWLPWRRTVASALMPLIAIVLVLRAQEPDPIARALAVAQKAAPLAPVVVGEAGLYIELMEAADPGTRADLVYLARPSGAFSPDPTNENELVRIARLNPEYRVRSQAAFLGTHKRFYVLTRLDKSIDTTTPSLLANGLLKKPVDAGHGILLYPSVASAEGPRGGGKR
ncbi:MAG TPA: hypothetical protein VIJ04_08490 [Xanthobacteraceae bacterium]